MYMPFILWRLIRLTKCKCITSNTTTDMQVNILIQVMKSCSNCLKKATNLRVDWLTNSPQPTASLWALSFRQQSCILTPAELSKYFQLEIDVRSHLIVSDNDHRRFPFTCGSFLDEQLSSWAFEDAVLYGTNLGSETRWFEWWNAILNTACKTRISCQNDFSSILRLTIQGDGADEHVAR